MRYLKTFEDVTINANVRWDNVLRNLILSNDIETIRNEWINTLFFDINTVGQFGMTPLKIATNDRNVEIMKLFLDNGADPNFPAEGFNIPLVKNSGRSPLMSLLASYNGQPDKTIECMQLLISRGANVNARDKGTGKTPVIYAAECCDSIAVMKELIKNGANLFVFDDHGNDALYYTDQRVKSKVPKAYRMLKWLTNNYFNDFAKYRLARTNSKRFDL